MRNRNSGTVMAVATALASLAGGAGRAQAQQPAPAGVVAGVPAESARRPLGIVVTAGMRYDLVRSAALDPFSASDSVSQGTLGAGYRFGEVDGAGLAVGFEWSRGSESAAARSAATDLKLDRLTLGLEARYPVLRRLAVFVRLAPGLLRTEARWYDLSAPPAPYQEGGGAVLTQKKWSPAMDVGAGVAFRFADLRSPGLPSTSLWLVADGGYGFSPGHDVTLRNPTQPPAGRVDEPIRLGNLSLSGGFARVRLAASF